MSVPTQTAAIAQIAATVGGSLFTTQPAKSVSSNFSSKFDNNATKLIDSNDPFHIISNHIESKGNKDVTTIATNGKTLLKNLPFLSKFKFSNVVIHVELTDSDYNTVTSIRDLNYPILISQNNKEASDFALAAYIYSNFTSSPILHFFSSNSTELKKLELVSAEKVQDLIKNFASENTAGLLSQIFSYIKPIVGHLYKEFEFFGSSSNSDLILYLGHVSKDLLSVASAEKVSIISIKVYRPFTLDSLLSNVPNSINSLTLVEQSLISSSTQFSPLLLDLFQDASKLLSKNIKKIVSANFGIISDYKSALKTLLANVNSSTPIQNLFIGNNKVQVASKLNEKISGSVKQAQDLESAYIKILNQVNESKLNILNKFSDTEYKNESSPEYGFGIALYKEEQYNKLVQLVHDSIIKNEFSSPNKSELIEILSNWLVQARENGSKLSSEENEKLSKQIINLLEVDNSKIAKDLLAYEEYFTFTNDWIIGSDAWSYDLGASGIHNLIASGKNTNILLIDSDPYDSSEKKINGFRKKDVGLYAMNYGGVYVASVAVYSSYTQVLQALIEANNFNGPSIVLAYLPYNEESDSPLTVLQETKKAVDSGYWPLYRYDPSAQNDSDSFKLDSSNIRKQLKDFLDRENKLSLLTSKNPLLSRNLTASLTSDIRAKQEQVADEAYAKLLEGLSGPPLTIAFASDGGNAQNVAKKIGRQALGRGLKATVLQIDDIALEDLAAEENIVFVTSTSGQGEFPQNGKQLWDGLRNSLNLDLTGVKYSVFGLGDSQYWPRKEDKHYYNKPAVDLFNKLKFFGATELAELGLGDDQDADGFQTGYNAWEPKLWEGLGVSGIGGVDEPKPITNEDMKINSDYLRGTIVEGLNDQSTGAICAVDQQLTKFHGIYMQDDRDIRDERKSQGLEPAYSFMVRVRLPGGGATPDQYLKMDELADVRGNGTLKLTTRATFQLHGVVKHDLKPAIRGMNSTLMDTLAACGDVNRNVMVSALPTNAKIHSQVSHYGSLISEYLLPQTTAYHEIWLEGADPSDKPGDTEVWANRKEGPTKTKTLVAGNALSDVEPMYGPTYLPRKFKVVITVPPYNDVDVYAHDIGLIAIVEDNEVIGFNMLVGGGMGSTHNNKKTYPRTGSMFGFVAKEDVHIACEKVMLIQRDFGDRTNRKHARLKYTIDDLGVEVYKAKVEEIWGKKFQEPKPFEIKSNVDYFGWARDETGLNHFTAFIENGRIEDTPDLPQKTGLKEIAHYMKKTGHGEFRLTGNQHILISNIKDEQLQSVKDIMAKYKLDNTNFSALRLSSAACVAFPTCGLAMAESERYLPVLISKIEESLEEYGLRHDSVVMRMTGCPNGCARPWLAEVALVGKAFGAYNLLLGGGHHGQRLNKIYRYSIKEEEILAILKPLFKRWALEREENEPFGDFLIRVGVIAPTLEGKYFHDDIPEDA